MLSREGNQRFSFNLKCKVTFEFVDPFSVIGKLYYSWHWAYFSGLLSRFSLNIGHIYLSNLKLVIFLVTKLMPCDRVMHFVSV